MAEIFQGVVNGRGLTGEHVDSIRLSGFPKRFRAAISGAIAGEGATVQEKSSNVQGVVGAAISVLDADLVFGRWVIDGVSTRALCVHDGEAQTVWLLTGDGKLLKRDSSGRTIGEATDATWVETASVLPDIIERRIWLAELRVRSKRDDRLTVPERIARREVVEVVKQQGSGSGTVVEE